MDQVEQSVKKDPRPIIQAIKGLVLRGSADVIVRRGEPSMMVVADKPEDVITEVRNGRLIISTKPVVILGNGFTVGSGKGGIRIGCMMGGSVTINHGHISNVTDGAVMVCGQHVTVEITLPDLPAASIEGSGNMSLEDLNQDELELEITGSGTIRATGQVKSLRAAISGSGDIKARDLVASFAELRISGSGGIKAQVTQSLLARVTGSGDIRVWGEPAKRDTRVTGSGDIRFKQARSNGKD